MSETVLKVRLGELTTARLRCGKCGTVVEIALKELVAPFERVCPNCAHIWATADSRRFSELARAILGLEKCAEDVKVEFVIPQPESK